MRRLVDHVLCKLPFEVAWYRERGCPATYIGHPYFDQLGARRLDGEFVEQHRAADGPLVTILPGSRTQEVSHNLKWLLKAASLVKARVPEVRFVLASFKPSQAEMARQMIDSAKLSIEVYVGRTGELIEAADCCMAVSGSVSLELLYHTKPTAILYWITPTAYRVQRFFRKVKYITLVNLLVADELFPKEVTSYDPDGPDAERVPMPEYLTCQDKSAQIAGHVIEWLTEPVKREAVVARLAELKAKVGDGGASRRGAEYILRHLAAIPAPVPRPHFLPHQAASPVGM